MKKLNSTELNGKGVKLELKNEQPKIGYLPVQSSNEQFNKKNIYFLPWEKNEEFHSKFSVGSATTHEQVEDYLEVIERKDIESYEIMEQDISSIYLENKKPIPTWLQIRTKNKTKPGHIFIEYKIPQYDKWFEIGSVQIKNSQITLPLSLAFLSYAKEDKQKVENVMEKLHRHGVLTWYDEKDLIPGDDWKAKIEEAIEKSDYVLVFLSSDTMQKTGYKNKEIKYALEQRDLRPSGKRYIIPILLDECEPPRRFSEIQWLMAWKKNWQNKLLAAVGKIPDNLKE